MPRYRGPKIKVLVRYLEYLNLMPRYRGPKIKVLEWPIPLGKLVRP